MAHSAQINPIRIRGVYLRLKSLPSMKLDARVVIRNIAPSAYRFSSFMWMPNSRTSLSESIAYVTGKMYETHLAYSFKLSMGRKKPLKKMLASRVSMENCTA